ncbi:allophanate hydrolase subunit 1 [Acidisoma cellulosilytica]|uniref:Allophanate hydrolase subunit 1 n=1 Tax=Acidisoma cellulosilyticum TaxID=2802395 RepID=A0A963Z510_9PROT|nr:allophanate hydrolase subunit 1 [Acidisoma cellulosilyticum]MCB8882140.1 allophanate hydrolase subunit 1 [Acidisoma cellulosilyticum]
MMYPEPRFLDAGEAALVVEFGREVDPTANDTVLALDAALTLAPLAGLRELVPTYRSLMIHYDPLVLPRGDLIAQVQRALALPAGSIAQPQHWVLPCCYDLPYGEDLDEAAGILGLTRDRAVALHIAGRYRVYMYGFAPGYAYLGGLAPELAISRRPTPRPPHPRGAIMIGGGLCGVATFPMPTGWYVLGRTPERLYAQGRDDAFLIQPGDILRFDPVDVASFDALEARAAEGEMVARKESA